MVPVKRLNPGSESLLGFLYCLVRLDVHQTEVH